MGEAYEAKGDKAQGLEHKKKAKEFISTKQLKKTISFAHSCPLSHVPCPKGS
jgi:hypothetical protein